MEELSTGSRPSLRQTSSTPDIVRASRPGLGTKYDQDTIDKLLARPQKIRIPERYVPELVSGFFAICGASEARKHAGEDCCGVVCLFFHRWPSQYLDTALSGLLIFC